MCYKDWVKQEAAAIGSDGCTVVSEIYHWCCLQHDLCYHYARDPRDAYKVGWPAAKPITRAESDRLFRECMQSLSPMKKGSPLAFWRWLGVRAGGWKPWRDARANDPHI